jgi:hypothetical protein
MRFISHITNFAVQIIEPRSHPTQYGDVVVDREGYTAQFTTFDVTDADVAFAEEAFVKGGLIHGRKYEMDEVTPVPLITRLSVFDTDERALQEDWDPEFRELVEEKLIRRSINHPDYRLVERLAVDPPWPRYLDFKGTLAQLMQKIDEDGYDPHQVLAYERATANRQMIIDALEQKLVDQTVAREREALQEITA